MPGVLYRFNSAGQWVAPGRDPFATRDALTYGTYRPEAGVTAGVANEETLTLWEGDLTTQYAGQVFRNLRVTGRTKIRHDGCKFYYCKLEGGTPSGSSFGTVEAFQSRVTPTEFWDCTIVGSVQNISNTNAIQGRDFTLYRCVLEGAVDGIGAQYANVKVYGSVIRNVRFYSPDPGHSDNRTHNDGIQVHGGSGFTFVGNSIEMGQPSPGQHNAAIMLTQDVAATSNVLIDRNWIYSIGTGYCQVGINLSQTGSFGPGAYTGYVTITNNRFSPASTWITGRAGLIDSATKAMATISGNVYDNTGLAALI